MIKTMGEKCVVIFLLPWQQEAIKGGRKMKKITLAVLFLVMVNSGAFGVDNRDGWYICTGVQSFEIPAAPGGYYFDTGDPLVDHDLVNNAGEPDVDGPHIYMGSNPPNPPINSFDASYINTRGGIGLTDGDYVGITSDTSVVGAWWDGVQGYKMSGCDGMMVLTLDCDGTAVTWDCDIFIQSTDWEADDLIRIDSPAYAEPEY